MPDKTPDPHEFVFELDRAIRDQVIEKLASSPIVPLVRNSAPQASGIYALYYKKSLVYVGKASRGTTVSKRTLRSRLNEHVGKLEHRDNLKMEDLTCRFLTIASDWFVWAAEFALIGHFQPDWNNSGFGSKMPGAGRPGTHRVSKFDQQFPKKAGAPPVVVTEGEDESEGEPPSGGPLQPNGDPL